MSEYHLACGTTSLLPTTLTATLDNTIKALQDLLANFGISEVMRTGIIAMNREKN